MLCIGPGSRMSSQTFNGCLARLHETYTECLEQKQAYVMETDAEVATHLPLRQTPYKTVCAHCM
eukprot:COSAG05_NODE_329_length_11294_cov_59.570076_5_plen_64_part_00